MRNGAGDNIKMIKVALRKNEIEPSRDFEKIIVFPYFIPIIADIESEMLNTSKAAIVVCVSKMKMVAAEPINTHEAPDNILDSIGRVKEIKILVYSLNRNLLYLLP